MDHSEPEKIPGKTATGWPHLNAHQAERVVIGEEFLELCVHKLDALAGGGQRRTSAALGTEFMKGKQVELLADTIYNMVVSDVMNGFDHPKHGRVHGLKTGEHRDKKGEHEELDFLRTLHKICLIGPQVLKRHGSWKGIKQDLFGSSFAHTFKKDLQRLSTLLTVFNTHLQKDGGPTDAILANVLKFNFSGKTDDGYNARIFKANYEKTVKHYTVGDSPAKSLHKFYKTKSRNAEDIVYTDMPTDDQIYYIKEFLLNNPSSSKLDEEIAVQLREDMTQFGLKKATRDTMARAKKTVDEFYKRFSGMLEKIQKVFNQADEGHIISEAEIDECIGEQDTASAQKREVQPSAFKDEEGDRGKQLSGHVSKMIAEHEAKSSGSGGGRKGSGSSIGGVVSAVVSAASGSGTPALQPRIVLQFL